MTTKPTTVIEQLNELQQGIESTQAEIWSAE